MNRSRIGPEALWRLPASIGLLAILGACANVQMPAFLQGQNDAADESVSRAAGAELVGVERDIEAPEVFSADEPGLWDGRPSLGGVWVAHPDVTAPERVLIRNASTGAEIVGALFKRERDAPGPRFQVSSDTANAIGLLPGAPTDLYVVALKRAPANPATGALDATGATTGDAAPADTLPVAADAAAAPDAAPVTAATAVPDAAAEMAALDAHMLRQPGPISAMPLAAATRVETSTLDAAEGAGGPPRPFVQIGTFSSAERAEAAAEGMRRDGMAPNVVRTGDSWRVLMGPARNVAELDLLLERARVLGYGDAFATRG